MLIVVAITSVAFGLAVIFGGQAAAPDCKLSFARNMRFVEVTLQPWTFSYESAF